MAISAMGKLTWWNKLRVERNIRYKDLMELFNYKSQSAIGGWFSGQRIPSDENIAILCDFFDVEFEEGKRHFVTDNEHWVSENHKDKRSTTGTAEGIARIATGESEVKEHKAWAKTGEEPEEERQTDIFEMVYGKLPYDLFRKFADLVAGKDDNALSLIYGKVTFEEFIFIQNLIKEA